MHKANLVLLLKEFWTRGSINVGTDILLSQGNEWTISEFQRFLPCFHISWNISYLRPKLSPYKHYIKTALRHLGIFFFTLFFPWKYFCSKICIGLILEEGVNSHFYSISRKKPPHILKTSLFWVMKIATISMQYLIFYIYGNITYINWFDIHTSLVK